MTDQPAAPASTEDERVEPDIAGLTDTGRVRSQNQDQFLLATLNRGMHIVGTSLADTSRLPLTSPSENTLLMVADGVGGGVGGQEASGAALEAVLRYLARQVTSFFGRPPSHETPLHATLQQAALESHEFVRQRAAQNPEHAGMSTTLTVVLEVWPQAFVLQVGDSRCYRLRGDELELVTKDQTIAQQLVEAGAMGEHTAMRSRWNNVLASSIGGSEAMPVTSKLDLARGDVLLLCSDGLTKHVTDEEIVAHLGQDRSATETCQALVHDALEGGGTDNVTVVVARF